jgi:hypothetical protein
MDIFLVAFGTVVLYLAVRVLSETKRRDKELVMIRSENEVQSEILRQRRIDALYGKGKND